MEQDRDESGDQKGPSAVNRRMNEDISCIEGGGTVAGAPRDSRTEGLNLWYYAKN
jgi:hypothetical protein